MTQEAHTPIIVWEVSRWNKKPARNIIGIVLANTDKLEASK